MDQRPGTNYFAPLDANVNIALTEGHQFAVYGECNGNPNVVALQANVYVTGCEMRRTDILSGNNIYFNTGTLAVPIWTISGGGGGSGTVTDVSVVSANGFAGTVATSTTTPAITLSTTATGILQGNGTAISGVTDGIGGQVLTTNGAGVYSFATVAPASLTYKQVAYGDATNAVTSDNKFTRDPSNNNTTIIESSVGATFGRALIFATGASLLSDSGSNVSSDGTGAYVQFPVPGFSTTYNGFLASGTGAYIKTTTGSATVIAKWPTSHGAAGEVLTDDGSGILYWSSGGGSLPALSQYHIYNGDAGSAAQDSGANFLWNETAFTLRVGDLTTSANETQLLLDDSLENFGIINAGSYFLRVNIAAGNYFFGDESNTANGTRLFINDTTQVTRFRGTYNTTPDSDFLNIDFSGGIAQFGDISGSGSGMLVSVDDPSKTVFFGATSLTFWQIDALNENYTGMLGGNASMYIDGSSGTGLENTFLGFASAGGLSTGNRNSVYGALAGGNTADGAENSFFGYSAGNGNSSGTGNTYIGSFAGNVNEGDDNTFIGRRAGLASTAASGMIAIGSDAGLTNDGNGNSIFIGVGADGTVSNVDGGIALGNGALTSKKMMVVGSDTMSMNFFYIGNGIASANPVQSVLFGITDYINVTTTDGNGSAMTFHYGNNTGNGLQGEYQFQGSSYNIGDVSGDLINADITFQRKSGSMYQTSNASVQTPMFIKFQGDGGFEVVWHIEAVDLTNGDSADWIIENAVNVVAGIGTTTGFDVITYGTTSGASTWTCESQTDGANGYGLKLNGAAATDIIWTVRWDITSFN